MSLNDNDLYLVNQNGTTSTVTQSNLMSLNDADLLLVNSSDDNTTKTVKFEDLKKEINPDIPISFTPSIAGNNAVGDVLTATAGAITGGTDPEVKSYQWKRNNADIDGATASTYTLVNDDVGTTISCTLLVAEPDNTGGVAETAVYDQIPYQPKEIVTPTILAPKDGAGIGGDITYTPKTSAITDVVSVDDPWTASTGFNDYTGWGGIVFGAPANLYVAVSTNTADSNQVAYSSDGKTWITSSGQVTTSPAQATWTKVAYASINGSNRYVAVGWYGSSMWSSDGNSWNLGNTPQTGGTSTGSAWSDVCYGDRFIAVAQNGDYRLMYSDDGENWTGNNVAFQDADGWFGIAYGNGTYVVISNANTPNPIRYSTDGGANWSNANQPPRDQDNAWYSICYGNGKFVAVSAGSSTIGQIAYSTDGINWTSVDSPQAAFWSGITYGNGKFVAVSFTGAKCLMYSEDAINWQLGEASQKIWFDVCYGNSEFVAVGDLGAMWSIGGTGLNTSALTLTNSNTYNAETDADMGTPISETFSAGQTVINAGGGSAGAIVKSVSDNTMVVAPYGGAFTTGMEVVNTVQATEFAPDADSLVLVGSIPASDPPNSINTWGGAKWEVSTKSDFSEPTLVANSSIVPDATQTYFPNEFEKVLADDTQYYARLKYWSVDPAISELNASYGPQITFKTAPEVINVDDLFSIDLYQGTSAIQKITNSLDLLSDGGVVWLKAITQNYDNFITNNPDYYLKTNANSAAQPDVDAGSLYYESFDNDGYTIGSNGSVNYSGVDFVGWSFRKKPGFFDVVRYNGNNFVPQAISHNLGALPQCIILKCFNQNGYNWAVYHGETLPTNGLKLNQTDGLVTSNSFWNDTAPTDTEFTVGNIADVNGLPTDEYVAYLFANTEGLIKCGSYSGNGNNDGDSQFIDTGFDPAWVLIKKTLTRGNWSICTIQTGSAQLAANLADLSYQNGGIDLTNTPGGFTVYRRDNNDYDLNVNGEGYIYVAIAKGGSTLFFDNEAFKTMTDAEVTAKYGVDPYTDDLKPFGIQRLMHEPTGVTAGYALCEGTDTLCPVEDLTNKTASLRDRLDRAERRNEILRDYVIEDLREAGETIDTLEIDD